VTARAVCIGLFCGVLLNLVMLYNDYYLHNTPLVLNHMPTAGMAVLIVLLAGNTVVRKVRGGGGLARGELLLVWAMVSIAGGIGATGFGRGVPGFAAGPAYFATAANEYGRYVADALPGWMVVTKDPDSRALRWYFEGLPRNANLPWSEWLGPLLAWGAFGLAMYAVMFGFTAVFQLRWVREERLTFPLTVLPLEMTRDPAPGRLVNDFLGNPVAWAGAAVPVLVYLVNGLGTYWTGLPRIPLLWSASGLFPDRPWSQFDLGDVGIYFPIVGLTFLLTTDVSFSIWFFYVLFQASFVLVAVVGAGSAGGFWGNWWTGVAVFQTAGAMLAFAAVLVWAARRGLGGWLRRAARGATDADADLLPPRLALCLLLGGMAGQVVWVRLAGASWWTAVVGITLFACEILVLTRLVVEAGLLYTGTEANSDDFLMGIVPAQWVGQRAAAAFVELRGAFMCDMREILMPYLTNGVQACSAAGMRAAKVLSVFALAVAIAVVAAMYGRITTAYKYGAIGGDTSYSLDKQQAGYGKLARFQKNPPAYQWVMAGRARIMPVTAAHTAVGAGVILLLVLLRGRFAWWPINPVGYLMCCSWGIGWAWFSVFLGWLAKALIMTFGGAAAYRKALPFFLGLVLGHAVIAVFWTLVSLVTATPGVQMLPN